MAVITEQFEGIVSSVEDDEKRGRIKVTCPDFTGDPDATLPDWIDPVLDWGWFYVPDVGEIVEIEIVTHDDSDEFPGASMILSPTIRWRNKRFYHTGDEDPRPINPEFTSTNYGKRRGFATPAGHVFMFDDTDGNEKILLTDKSGGKVEMDSATGQITIYGSKVILYKDTEPAVLGTQWKTLFDGHIHPTGTGPSGPPTAGTPILSSQCLSTKVSLD